MIKVMNFVKRLHEWANKREWLIFLLLIVVVLRIPSLFMPHYYGDEEIYFVMGRAWREGVPLYQAMFDHKPPLIYILAGLFPTMFSFRLMLLVVMGLHTYLFWELAKKFWRGLARPKLAYVSSLIFVILTTLPTLEGLTVNAELLMMLPVTAGMLVLWDAHDTKGNMRIRPYALAGLLMGIGWLYKIPVVADAAFAGLFFIIFQAKNIHEGLRRIWSFNTLLYIVGFVAPLLTTFVYYYLKGNGSAYLDTVLTMNLGYVSSWSTSTYSFNPLKSGLIVRGLILAVVMLILYTWRKKLGKELVFATLWLGFGIFGALLSARPYPHYLQQPVVPFSLWLPFIFVNERVITWFVWTIVGGLMVLMQWKIKFWGYPIISVYRNFWQYSTGLISKQEYFERFDNVKRNYEIGKYLNERLHEGEEIFVWGSDPTIYNLTNRLPTGGKYIVSFHVHDLKKHDYVMENLLKNKPKYVVWLTGATKFEDLKLWLEQNYYPVQITDDYTIYRWSKT